MISHILICTDRSDRAADYVREVITFAELLIPV